MQLERLNQMLNIKSIQAMIDQLEVVDPYTATAPILANAMLGNLHPNNPVYFKRYAVSRDQMLTALSQLEMTPENYADWMRNDGFKAWMWGVVTFAADIIKDNKTIDLAGHKLIYLLTQQKNEDHLIFFTWAWGFRGSLNQTEYKAACDHIKKGAERLIKADALWAWIMSLLAAAKVKHQTDYDYVKNKIMSIANTTSIIEALTNSLLSRNSELDHFQSNDFLALALAMVCYAAATIGDRQTFDEVLKATQVSIVDAQQENANAECILAILYVQLALLKRDEGW